MNIMGVPYPPPKPSRIRQPTRPTIRLAGPDQTCRRRSNAPIPTADPGECRGRESRLRSTVISGFGSVIDTWSVVWHSGSSGRSGGSIRERMGDKLMSAVSETRQGIGFPDWVIVQGSDRLFDWYGDTVTELGFVGDDGREIRLAVCDRNRRVIRAEYVGGGSVHLYGVAGLVRRFYGPDTYGHTEYFVAGEWS